MVVMPRVAEELVWPDVPVGRVHRCKASDNPLVGRRWDRLARRQQCIGDVAHQNRPALIVAGGCEVGMNHLGRQPVEQPMCPERGLAPVTIV